MACIICGGSLTQIKYKVEKCNDCWHTYVRYDGDGLYYHKTLYRSAGHDGTRGGGEIVDGVFTDEFHNRRHNICINRMKFLEPIMSEVDSVLDIGAGGGTFLNLIKDKVSLAEGTEVSDICNSNLTNDGYKVYHGAFTQMEIEKVYDLVTCWHVLEHIENLKNFPKKLYNVTGKYAVLEVPTNRHLRNPDDNFDGHFHYFSEKSLELLFKDYFNIDYIKEGVQKPCLQIRLSK